MQWETDESFDQLLTLLREHRSVVERCAAQHVDVMMEKPLAVNMEHARAIEAVEMILHRLHARVRRDPKINQSYRFGFTAAATCRHSHIFILPKPLR